MEPEKIDLAEFNITVEPLVQAASKLKEVMQDLIIENQRLEEEGQELSAAFIENEAGIRTLRSEYNKHIKVIQEMYQAGAQQANQQDVLNLLLKNEALSVAAAREENQQLKTIRENLNTATQEGRDQIQEINKKIQQNSDYIKENTSVNKESVKTTEEKQSAEERLGEIIDTQAKTITQAKEQNKELDKIRNSLNITTDEGRESLVKLNDKIEENKNLIKDSKKFTQQSTEALGDQISREEQLTNVLNQEAVSIQAARDQNKILNKLRNETNVTTEEGRKQLDKLNEKLDSNNEFIKENADQYLKQKINIGNYTESIKDAFDDLNIFNGGLGNFVQKSTAAGGANVFLATTFKTLTASIRGAIVASLAFIATPIGAVIAAIGLVLAPVISYLTSTQDGINKVNEATQPLMAIWKTFIGVAQELGKAIFEAFENPKKAAKELYDYVKDQLIVQFKSFGMILEGIATQDFSLVKKGFKDLGENASKQIGKINGAVGEVGNRFSEAIKKGKELAVLQNKLSAGEADYINRQGELTEEIKKQNLIAEDTTKSLSEREAAVKKTIDFARELNKLATERIGKELEIIDLENSFNDTSDAARAERAKKQQELNQIRASGLELETTQNNKLNIIQSQALANQKKILKETAEVQKAKLKIYEQEQGIKAKLLFEEIAVAEEIRDRKIEIAEQEYKSSEKKEKDRLALIIATNTAEEELLKARVEASIEEAEREYDIFKENLDREVNQLAKFSEEWLEIEKRKNNKLLEQDQKLAQTRLEQGVINQQQYDDAIFNAKEEARIANEEVELQRLEAKRVDDRARELAEFENKMLLQEEQAANLFELERERVAEENRIRLEDLNRQLDEKLISQENYQTQVELLQKQSAKATTRIFEQEQELKLTIMETALNSITDLVGKNTVAGKAMSVAASLINTYQGITKALGSAPPPFNYIAAAGVAAAGFKAVKEIIKTKIPGQSGGGGVTAPNPSFPTNTTGTTNERSGTRSNVTRESDTARNSSTTTTSTPAPESENERRTAARSTESTEDETTVRTEIRESETIIRTEVAPESEPEIRNQSSEPTENRTEITTNNNESSDSETVIQTEIVTNNSESLVPGATETNNTETNNSETIIRTEIVTDNSESAPEPTVATPTENNPITEVTTNNLAPEPMRIQEVRPNASRIAEEGALSEIRTNASILSELIRNSANSNNTRRQLTSNNSIVQSDLERNFNTTILVNEIADAVRIGSNQGTREGSREGITNLNENRRIRETSTF